MLKCATTKKHPRMTIFTNCVYALNNNKRF